MGNCLAGHMWWPVSGGGLAVVQIQSRETCRPVDWVHGEWVAAGEAQRNVRGSREMVEGVEELVNPDITPLLGLHIPSSWKILGPRKAIRLWGGPLVILSRLLPFSQCPVVIPMTNSAASKRKFNVRPRRL